MPTDKRLVHLQFPDLKSLVDYILIIDITKCDISKTNFILDCELMDLEIELALNGYGAIMISECKMR